MTQKRRSTLPLIPCVLALAASLAASPVRAEGEPADPAAETAKKKLKVVKTEDPKTVVVVTKVEAPPAAPVVTVKKVEAPPPPPPPAPAPPPTAPPVVAAPAIPAKKQQIFVSPLVDNASVGQTSTDAFTQTLAAELARRPGYNVLSTSDLRTLVANDQIRQMLGCDSEACARDLGAAVGSDLLCSGQVGKLGNDTVITLTLLDSKSGHAIARVSRSIPQTLGRLAVARAAEELLARANDERLSELGVTSDPTGASVLVDGQEVGVTPVPPFSIRPGPHKMILQKDLFKLAEVTLSLAEGERQMPVIPLMPLEEQMKMTDVAKVANDAAQAGAAAAVAATQTMLTKTLQEAAEKQAIRDRAMEERAEAAEEEAKAARLVADLKAKSARLDADRAIKEADAARALASSAAAQSKADADASLKKAEEARVRASADAEQARVDAEKARLAVESQAKETARIREEIRIREETRKLEQQAELDRARAEAANRQAADSDALREEMDAKVEQLRKENAAAAEDARAAAQDEVRAQVIAAQNALLDPPERLRTSAVGFRFLIASPSADVIAGMQAVGGSADDTLTLGLDGKIPLFWRTYLGLEADWMRTSVVDGSVPDTAYETSSYVVPVGAVHLTASFGLHLPLVGPLYLEGSGGVGARITQFTRHRTLNIGDTVNESGWATVPVAAGQMQIGFGFGAWYVAFSLRYADPLVVETAASSTGATASIAGFGPLLSLGGVTGVSW